MPYVTKTRTLPRTFWQRVFFLPAKTHTYEVWRPTPSDSKPQAQLQQRQQPMRSHSYSRLIDKVNTKTPYAPAPVEQDNGFLSGLIVGQILSHHGMPNTPAPEPRAFKSGGGGDFGGGGASGSWESSPSPAPTYESPAPSPSYDSSSYDSGSSSSDSGSSSSSSD